MLTTNYTEILLNLQGVIVKKVEKVSETTKIHVEMPLKSHSCPCCGTETKYVHDYRVRKVKDLPAFSQNVLLFYRQRRYICKCCDKRFAEKNTFVAKYYRVTHRLVAEVFNKCASVNSFSGIAEELNLSTSTTIRIFDTVSYSKPTDLPEVLAIDEFKGNAGNDKYQAIITDPKTGVVLDILPDRKQSELIKYFKSWHVSQRNTVNFFVSDMWRTYAELAEVFFKNSVYLVDKYHYVRQIIWAFERTRKRIQKKYGKTNRLMFKNSKRILTKRQAKLKPEQAERVEHMLYLSDELRSAYYLKEGFYEVLDSENRDVAKQKMSEWIEWAQDSGLSEYVTCSKTLLNWQVGILNTFSHPYSNGFTEGCNNKIKVLKRNAYGYRNFNRFRNRILHIFNYKKKCAGKKNEAA